MPLLIRALLTPFGQSDQSGNGRSFRGAGAPATLARRQRKWHQRHERGRGLHSFVGLQFGSPPESHLGLASDSSRASGTSEAQRARQEQQHPEAASAGAGVRLWPRRRLKEMVRGSTPAGLVRGG